MNPPIPSPLRRRANASQALLLAFLLLASGVSLADLTVAHSNATKVLSTTATLNAGLTATGGTNPVCWFYWGVTNAGTNTGSWGSSTNLGTQVVGKVSYAATGLSPSTLYYYRLLATNDYTAWTPVGAFTTLGTMTELSSLGGTSTNIPFLIPGDATNWLCVTNGQVKSISETEP